MYDCERDFIDACAQNDVLMVPEYPGLAGANLGELRTTVSLKILRSC